MLNSGAMNGIGFNFRQQKALSGEFVGSVLETLNPFVPVVFRPCNDVGTYKVLAEK